MAARTELLDKLIKSLGRLPGIGQRSAERLAYHLISAPETEAMELARAIEQVRKNLRRCARCHNLAEEELCPICRSSSRDTKTICVVEGLRDLESIEGAGGYNGLYHVLGGRIAPLEGVEADDLTLRALIQRVNEEKPSEVIVATSTTMEGDATALAIVQALEGAGVRITRPARGLGAGTSLEYANRAALADALEGRREIK